MLSSVDWTLLIVSSFGVAYGFVRFVSDLAAVTWYWLRPYLRRDQTRA